jgi:hypothetical protein
VRHLLVHYDRLVGEARAHPDRVVLTHGEPHPANLILTKSGWVLLDSDTAKVAPPERDLWMVDSGQGEVVAAYQNATSTRVLSSMLDMYRLLWDLAEIAIYTEQFRSPHVDTLDTQESWKNLNLFLGPHADGRHSRSSPSTQRCVAVQRGLSSLFLLAAARCDARR